MNVNALATQLLTLFSPEERSIPDHADYPGRNGAVLLAMNGALQEIFGKASPWVRYDERGAVLRAPVTDVEITVTNGGTAATISAGTWQDWFSGCQIRIDGAAVENRIRNNSRAVSLKFPHDGPSGITTATVWHTSLDLGADVMEVTGGVLVNGREIFPVPSLRAGRAGEEDFGFGGSRAEPVGTVTGEACGYLLETWCPSANAAPALRLRLTAAPRVQSFLEYSALTVPLVVTDLASLDTLPIPLQFVQSIFYPVARQRLTACEFYRGGGNAEEIGRSYQAAMKALADLHPRKQSGIRLLSRL
jgi:hypothetical protein